MTVCTQDRQRLLCEIDVGDAVLSIPIVRLSDMGNKVKEYLENMNKIIGFVVLENYVIMPNHVHLLILIKHESGGMLRTASPTNAVIPRIIHGLKSVTTKQIGYSIWQRAYHDHIIRNENEYLEIWKYIDENPIRWTEDKYFLSDGTLGTAPPTLNNRENRIL